MKLAVLNEHLSAARRKLCLARLYAQEAEYHKRQLKANCHSGDIGPLFNRRSYCLDEAKELRGEAKEMLTDIEIMVGDAYSRGIEIRPSANCLGGRDFQQWSEYSTVWQMCIVPGKPDLWRKNGD